MISMYVGGTTAAGDTRLGQRHRILCTFDRLVKMLAQVDKKKCVTCKRKFYILMERHIFCFKNCFMKE